MGKKRGEGKEGGKGWEGEGEVRREKTRKKDKKVGGPMDSVSRGHRHQGG